MSALRVGMSLGFGVAVAIELGASHAFAQAAAAGTANAAKPKPVATAPSAKAAPEATAPSGSATPPAASTAPAAPASAPSAPTAVNAPDIVRLKNGGFLRGTISESVPGDYVVVVLVTGETRKIPYVDVQYAGPANEQPNRAAAAAPAKAATATAAAAGAGSEPSNRDQPEKTQPFTVVHAKESAVSVESAQSGVTLYRRAASAGRDGHGMVSGYEEVCTVPCSISMPAGTHTFAVAKPGGKPHEADAVVLPPGNAKMNIAVVDRTPVRVGLGLVGLAGLVTGFVLLFSDSGDEAGNKSIAAPLVLTGAGAGLFGLAFAIPDGATVKAWRANDARLLDQGFRDVGMRRNRTPGLTFTGHF